MEKVKCYRKYEKEGIYIMCYGVPEGKSIRNSIIIVAAYNEAEAAEKLEKAIEEMPEKFKSKYEFN